MGICGSNPGQVTSKRRVLNRDSVQREGTLRPPKTHGPPPVLLFLPGCELEAAGGRGAENQVLIQNAQLLHRLRKKGFERPKRMLGFRDWSRGQAPSEDGFRTRRGWDPGPEGIR